MGIKLLTIPFLIWVPNDFWVGIQRMIWNVSPSTYVVSSLVSLGIVVFQIIISNLWMLWFQYGPLEWLWRCGTYWALVPIRKKNRKPAGLRPIGLLFFFVDAAR